jgi:hypothetical protein
VRPVALALLQLLRGILADPDRRLAEHHAPPARAPE